ncbi:MAG: c-type cytochrome biogenesis protein CcmI [Rhizobiaceae bacterium]|nr:c-type cytochrome biogenesis protein CcmI [Rhizobiaceae bacterium]
MIFWILIGLLTLVTVSVVVIPVFGNAKKLDSPLEYDKEIYKARLKEIEQERTLGTISEREYENSLAEEGKRLLMLASSDSNNDVAYKPTSQKSAVLGALFAAILVPLIALTAYFNLGAINTPDQPLQARLDADPRGQSLLVLLQRAENQLAKNPDDGRGWLIVAPVYMRMGRVQESITAYRNVIRILGPTPELQTSLGEAIAVAANGEIDKEALELFKKAADADPASLKPRFFMAIALNQSEEFEKAVPAWQNLIKNSPTDSPWLDVARQQLKLAQGKIGNNIPDAVSNAPVADSNAPGNPTAEDIEAAGQLSTDDRQSFINSMVERLSAELEENPQNKAGWQRIIRSYTVLGRKDEALAAIEKAMQVFEDDKNFMTELEQNKQALVN